MNKYNVTVIIECAAYTERVGGTVESKLEREDLLHYIADKISDPTTIFLNLHEVDEWCRIDRWHAIPVNRIAEFYVEGA